MAVLTSLRLDTLAAMHSAAACTIQKNHLPAQKFCDKWAAYAKPHPAELWGGRSPPQNSRPRWAMY